MELRIRDSTGIINVDFGEWLIPQISSELILNADHYNLELWDDYLNNSKDVKRLFKKTYQTKDVILYAANYRLNNLKCTGFEGHINIGFDNNKFVPGFDRLRLSTLIKTINYGTLDRKGCFIFSNTFHKFARNIEQYVQTYYNI